MLEKNQVYETAIESITSEGSGVGRIDGMAVFVPGTCPGDVARVRIVKKRASYAYGRLEEVLAPGPGRVPSYCPVSQACGGCQLAHMAYPAQLAAKRRIVTDALARLGGFAASETPEAGTLFVPPVLGMETPLGYRNKMVFPIGPGKDGRPIGGFYRARSHEIIPLAACPIGEPLASAVLQCVLDYMERFGIAPYEEASHTGVVRRVLIRTGRRTGEAMVVVSANADALPHSEALVTALRELPGPYRVTSILLNINRRRTNLVLGDRNILLYGAPVIHDTLCDLAFAISPHSFFQVNPVQTEVLYEKAMDFAALTGRETVVELYAGIGTISLCAARHAAQVYAVEIVPEAVRDAIANAKANGIANVSFLEGDAARLAEDLLVRGIRPDVVLIDPPRKGCGEETVRVIAQMAPERVVYVSCNPATLARDAAQLREAGYMLTQVQPVDMFPGTMHVETIVLLQRRDT